MKKGISIIEVMVCVSVLTIAVIGSSGYRYFAIMDIRRSDNEIAAGRIALQLCESWKGVGGVSSFNPLNDPNIGLNIEASSSTYAPEKPAAFTLLTNGGYYKVVSDDRTFYATMSYLTTTSASGNLETLNVIVNWTANPSVDDSTSRDTLCLTELLVTH